MPVNVPTTLLRSFVAIVDSGSMLSAADQVFVTQSALSLQIKRLEELVQQPLFVRDGRRLSLTQRGELLLDYARRLLSLHDEAIKAVSSGRYAGTLRIGMVQDFAEALLSGLLIDFAQLYPDAQIYARISGTAEMLGLLERGELDIVLGFAAADDPKALKIAPMAWHGDERLTGCDIIPLAVLEKPCRFREAAIAALEAGGRSYRLAVETPNLSTLRAAVAAGLGLTCRSPMFLSEQQLIHEGLPPLPEVACVVLRAARLDEPASHLADLAVAVVRDL